MKSLTRRQLITATLYTALLPAPRILSARQPDTTTNSDLQRTMTTLVDMILPADAQSPSASQLDIDTALWKIAEDDPSLEKLFLRGLRWLDKESFGNFSTLQNNYKHQLLLWMDESASPNSLPNIFFKQVRYQAVGLYYATEQARAGLGITQAPQPVGYPDIASRRREPDV